MAAVVTSGRKAGIGIDTSDDSVQRLSPSNELQRFEGVGFSPTGDILAVAASDADTVFLFDREHNGRFQTTPSSFIPGIAYPHDVSFSDSGDLLLLAVAQRAGAITIFERPRGERHFRRHPAFEILGAETRLGHSDAVAFIPPDNAHLAACNLTRNSVSFYRRHPGEKVCFGLEPVFELRDSLAAPDGLAFSLCGEWLAVANHGNNTVSIFSRASRLAGARDVRYEPAPVAVIADPALRYPHSVAFMPVTDHLAVTSAGANFFSVYEQTGRDGRAWPDAPVLRHTIGSEDLFREVNALNKMEGGPKGIAISGDSLAVCSPEHGVTIYKLR